MPDEFTIPSWIIVCGAIAFAFSLIANLIQKAENKDAWDETHEHEKAWKHLATIAPVLKRRDTFGGLRYEYSGNRIPENEEPTLIDYTRIIEAGEKYDQRHTYREDNQRLRHLDKVLGPLREEKE